MKRTTLGVLVLLTLPAAAVFGCLLPRENACAINGDCTAGNVCMEGICQPMPCASDTECGDSTDCEKHTCVDSVCKTTLVPESPLPDAKQKAHDCAVLRCDGKGAVVKVDDPTDVPVDDGNPCTDEVCGANGAAHVASPAEKACTSGGNQWVCDGATNCVECVSDPDCAGAGDHPRCNTAAHACVSCSNGVQDSDEVGIDCGGVCPLKCVLESCTADADCVTGHCGGGQCRLTNAQACTGNAQCLSFHCVGTAPNLTCQACSGSSPCTSGTCVGGVCSSP